MRLFQTSSICLLFVAVVACGPIVMIPGGALSGNPKPLPSDWAFTDAVDTVQLETRPDDPYSVNIWAVSFQDSIYVVAGSGLESKWAQNISEDPRVRLKVDDSIYELQATPDDTPDSRTAFLAAAKIKYDFEPESEDADKAILYRLIPR